MSGQASSHTRMHEDEMAQRGIRNVYGPPRDERGPDTGYSGAHGTRTSPVDAIEPSE